MKGRPVDEVSSRIPAPPPAHLLEPDTGDEFNPEMDLPDLPDRSDPNEPVEVALSYVRVLNPTLTQTPASSLPEDMESALAVMEETLEAIEHHTGRLRAQVQAVRARAEKDADRLAKIDAVLSALK